MPLVKVPFRDCRKCFSGKCRFCGEIGHKKAVCWAWLQKKAEKDKAASSGNGDAMKIGSLEEEEDDDNESVEYIFML